MARRLGSWLAASALVLGCARPAPAPAAWGDPLGVRPTLEEVFLEPPLSGTAPAIEALSADGRWVLLRWSPPEAEPERPAPLRLLAVDDPAASDWVGAPLAGLLPAAGDGEDAGAAEDAGADEGGGPEEPRATWWSPRGHVLAVARGKELWLLDPESGRCERAVTPPPEPDEPPASPDEPATGDGEAEEPPLEAEDAAEGPPAPQLGNIVSVRITPDGRQLRFSDRKELYSIPLEEDGFPVRETPLEEATWWSQSLDANALELDWSEDLSVVFGRDPRPRSAPAASEDEGSQETEDDGEGSATDEEPPAPAPEVVLLRENREVTLSGLAELEGDLRSTSLSPDGRFLAALHVDTSGEPEPTIVPNFLGDRVTTQETRRQLADDGPSPVRIYVWRTSSGEREELLGEAELPGDGAPEEGAADEGAADEGAEEEGAEEAGPPDGGPAEADAARLYWPRAVGWAPAPPEAGAESPARFLFERTSADFRELEVFCWTEGHLERLWHERDEAWIGGPARFSDWARDGSLVLIGSESHPGSTTPGRCQVFAIDPDTGESWQVTEVAGEVKNFTPHEGGGLLVEASLDDPAGRALLWLDAEAVRARRPVEPVRLGGGPYDRSAHWSTEGGLTVYLHGELLVPDEVWCAGLRQDPRPLTRTRPRAFDDVRWIRPVELEVEAPAPVRPPESTQPPTAATRRVRAHVYLPPGVRLDGSSSPPRAAIVFVHGAGYLQNVTDSMTRYPLNAMFHSRLARLGYPVIDVDYRGSAGYGRDFRTDVQYHLGGEDLEDIHRVVDELVARGVVDPERVGLYGGSYGGFLTLMALFTAPERWAAGAALRSVTDWRTYHPGYTQPRLGRPSTHPEAYERSSPIDLVDGLADPLLVLHGMQDRNVFAQDSIRLIEELIEDGRDFEAMLYPSQGHAFDDGRSWLDEYRRIERHLLRHLGPPLGRGPER